MSLRARFTPGLLALCACTLDAGRGFATLQHGELVAHWEVGGVQGALTTDLGYEVRVEQASLEVEHLTLLRVTGGEVGQAAAFDPANPPADVSLCHGGHCHADDGSLPSYEELQARASGGDARVVPVVEAHLDRELSLLDSGPWEIEDYAPSTELPRGSLDRAQLTIRRLTLRASVQGGELEGVRTLEVSLPLQEVLAAALAIEVDRDGPARLRPHVHLDLHGPWFDGIDFGALAAAQLHVDGSEAQLAPHFVRALLTTVLAVELAPAPSDDAHDTHEDEHDTHEDDSPPAEDEHDAHADEHDAHDDESAHAEDH